MKTRMLSKKIDETDKRLGYLLRQERKLWERKVSSEDDTALKSRLEEEILRLKREIRYLRGFMAGLLMGIAAVGELESEEWQAGQWNTFHDD